MNDILKNTLFFVVMWLATMVVYWISGFQIAVLFAIAEVSVTIFSKKENK